MYDMRLPKVLDEQLQEELLNHYIKTKDPIIKETLILHNLKLVKTFSTRYKVHNNPLRDEDDLFNEGVIGLMNSLESYDPEKGSFSHHAATHIKSSIRAYIRDKTQSIRVSAGVYELLYKIESFRREYNKQNDKEPTIREVSEALNLPYKRVESLLGIQRTVTSLDTPISEDEASTLKDIIEDPESDFTDEVIESIFIDDFLEVSRDYLQDNEMEVLRMSLGLNCKEYPLTEISGILNINYGYTSELRAKALRKLRKSSYIARLERELDEVTSWYRSPIYDSEGVKGNSMKSPVERIALERDEMRSRLLGGGKCNVDD